MAFDGYIKIDGIPGESLDEAHKDWIRILSYTQSVSQEISDATGTGGRTSGKADFDEFTFRKEVDKATPQLNVYCADGKHIPTVTVELCEATGEKTTFMTYTMYDVIIASVTMTGEHEDQAKPVEEVGLAFDQISWKYTAVDRMGASQGEFEAGWDLAANKKM